MIFLVSPFALTMSTNFSRNLVIWKQTLSCALWPGLDSISSVFDIITYMLLYFLVVPYDFWVMATTMEQLNAAFIMVFQTGWFIESMGLKPWLSICCVHQKLPFIQSRPAFSVVVTTLAATFFVTSLPYSPLASILKLSQLNGLYFVLLFAIIVLYMLSVTVCQTYLY